MFIKTRAEIKIVMLAVAFVVCAMPFAQSKAEEVENLPGQKMDVWKISEWESRRGWIPTERTITRDDSGLLIFQRKNEVRIRFTKTFNVDLDSLPVLEIATEPSRTQWRLTGQIESGKEMVLADFQTEGICRRNVAKRLRADGDQQVTLHLRMWGWGGHEPTRLVIKQLNFVTERPESNADVLSGQLLERHQRVMERASEIRALNHEHPSLRFRKSQKDELQRKASTTHRIFAGSELDHIERLDEEKAKPDIVLSPELLKKKSYEWRSYLLRIRPAEPPELQSGEGWSPFAESSTEGTWRVLCWHDFSRWVIGDALTDDPAFAQQARRWIIAMARWKFWKRPDYVYFDFGTAYPLQNFAYGYDIAYNVMTESERDEVRAAMAELAHGLYLNTLTGHGSIYNDLRGNHTAVSQCGLGMAGLVLLDEHPEAPQWVALAEQFMLEAFEEHTSGAWTESPSYGNYGVNEWLKFAEALRNVTGRDHLKHPFLRRYGEYQLMICDWEGRNLSYNQGGAGQQWNHWIFLYMAREWNWPELQWLGNFALEGVEGFSGYGDAFWWANPELTAKRPAAKNAGEHYADIGLSVWRSGWEDDPTILLHQCGRKGQHKEQNMNHFTLYVKGERILPDGLGTGTNDHNVPMINGGDQNKWGAGETVAFHSDQRSGYSLGDGTNPYRGKKALRHILYLRSGALVIVDDIFLSENNDETVTIQLHPNGDTQVDGSYFKVASGDATLLGVIADENGNMLVPSVKEYARSNRATHDIEAVHSGRGQARTITFLRFGESSELASDIMVVEKGEGYLDFLCGEERYRLGMKPGSISSEISTSAPLWLARFADGKPAVILAVTGTNTETVWIEAAGERFDGIGSVSWER